jgi:hypothetical protein
MIERIGMSRRAPWATRGANRSNRHRPGIDRARGKTAQSNGRHSALGAHRLWPIVQWGPWTIEEILSSACLVFILELRHALDERAKLLFTQVGNQRPNSNFEIAPEYIEPTIHRTAFR